MTTGNSHDIHFMMTEILNMMDHMVGDCSKNKRKTYDIDPQKMDDDDYMMLSSSRLYDYNPNFEGIVRNYYKGDIEAAIGYKNTPTYYRAALYMLWIFNQLGLPYEIGKLIFEWQNIANINAYSWKITTNDTEGGEHYCRFTSGQQRIDMLTTMHESDGEKAFPQPNGSGYGMNALWHHPNQYHSYNKYHVTNIDITLDKLYVRDANGRFLWKIPTTSTIHSVPSDEVVDKEKLKTEINIRRQRERGTIYDEKTQLYHRVNYIIGPDGNKIFSASYNPNTQTFTNET
jgi:hypothetical protein